MYLLFTAALLAPAFGQAPAPTYSGTVLAEGRPVAGATVWLNYYLSGEEKGRRPIEARTDAQGRFRLSGPKEPLAQPRDLIARAPDGRLGWFNFLRDGEQQAGPPRIELLPVGPARGRLTTRDGRPLADVRLRLRSLQVGAGKPFRRQRQLFVPDDLARLFETTTNADGSFTLAGIPLGASLSVSADAPGHGSPALGWEQGGRGDFTLEKAGRVRVRFTGADDPKQLAGLSLTLFSRAGNITPEGTRFVNSLRPVKAKGTDTLLIKDVLAGRGEIRVYGEGKAPYIPKESKKEPVFVVKPGELTEVTVVLEPTACARGRIIDRKTRAGIPGVHVSVRSENPDGRSLSYASAVTGPDGRFTVYARPGFLVLQTSSPPAGYLDLHATGKAVAVAARAEHTFPDVTLDPVVPVEGVVLDEAGRPVPDIVVWVAAMSQDRAAVPRTDAKGRFVLRMLADDEITALRARTPKAVTDGAVPLNVGQVQGPVKLVLSEKAACRFTGRVVDAVGKPVAGTDVGVIWHYPFAGRFSAYSTSRRLETLRTDAEGRFRTTALWPGDRYHVEVRPEGFAAAQSAEVKGKAGQVHDLGEIPLTRTNVTVRGVVVDAAGRPLAGVTVFNQGDAPARLSTTSDAAGRFRLSGLFDGPAYVFARKDGYRFTMARTDPASPEVRITLLPAGQVHPASAQLRRTKERAAAEEKLLRHVFDKTLALSHQATEGYRALVFECLARTDLERARKWLAQEQVRDKGSVGEGSRYARALRVAEAEHAAADDVDDALTVLAPLRDERGFDALMGLVKRFLKSDPPRALRFAEEAVVRARALELPGRAWTLAQAGDVVVRLGRKDAGKKLLAEAAALAEKFGPDSPRWYGRAWVARYVAAHDWPRARKLLEPLAGKEGYNHLLSPIAEALARTDVKAGLALVDEMKADGSTVRDVTRVRIACRAAERDAAAGVKVAEAIADGYYRAAALVHVAGIVAGRDRKLAWSLLDRSLTLYVEGGEEFRRHGGRGATAARAAWTAARAAELGHPDLAGVVARVLASRPTQDDSSSPAQALETKVRLAKVLALVDPATARQLLEGVSPRRKLLGSGYSGFESQDWLLARCLADPARGPALVDEALAEMKDGRGREFYYTGLLQLAQVLTTPVESRARAVMGLNSGLVFPEEE